VKDSFTRMHHERDAERKMHVAQRQAEAAAVQRRRQQLDEIRRDLALLFTESNPHRRGKLLESVLNRLFAVEGILVREAFTLVGDQGEGVIEQIDGAIELDGNVYLVEAKWWNQPLGAGATAQHLVRVYSRGDVKGLFISASGSGPRRSLVMGPMFGSLRTTLRSRPVQKQCSPLRGCVV
jgi:restriction system protein